MYSWHTILAQKLLLEQLCRRISFSRSLNSGCEETLAEGRLPCWREEEGVDIRLCATIEEIGVSGTCAWSEVDGGSTLRLGED